MSLVQLRRIVRLDHQFSNFLNHFLTAYLLLIYVFLNFSHQTLQPRSFPRRYIDSSAAGATSATPSSHPQYPH
jgi:hypothetical protein